jgi:hypothetical protein
VAITTESKENADPIGLKSTTSSSKKQVTIKAEKSKENEPPIGQKSTTSSSKKKVTIEAESEENEPPIGLKSTTSSSKKKETIKDESKEKPAAAVLDVVHTKRGVSKNPTAGKKLVTSLGKPIVVKTEKEDDIPKISGGRLVKKRLTEVEEGVVVFHEGQTSKRLRKKN